jgi:hypothetical protein
MLKTKLQLDINKLIIYLVVLLLYLVDRIIKVLEMGFEFLSDIVDVCKASFRLYSDSTSKPYNINHPKPNLKSNEHTLCKLTQESSGKKK